QLSVGLVLLGCLLSVTGYFLARQYADHLGSDLVFNITVACVLSLAAFLFVAFVCGFAARSNLYGRVGMSLASGLSLALVLFLPLTLLGLYWLAGAVACFIEKKMSQPRLSVEATIYPPSTVDRRDARRRIV